MLVFSHAAASGWLGWRKSFAEMYARNNIIVWGTRDLMRLFAVLLAAIDCRWGRIRGYWLIDAGVLDLLL